MMILNECMKIWMKLFLKKLQQHQLNIQKKQQKRRNHGIELPKPSHLKHIN